MLTRKSLGKKFLCSDNSIIKIYGYYKFFNNELYVGSNHRHYSNDGACKDSNSNIVKKLTYVGLLLHLITQKFNKLTKYIRLKKSDKHYRVDINLWEEKYTLLKCIHFYCYKIFSNGKEKTRYRLIRMKQKTARYINSATPLPPVIIGKKDFAERYNNNKYLVPLSYIIDLTAE